MHLTDRGVEAMGADHDQFVLPDISTGVHRIDHDESLTPQEKIDGRRALGSDAAHFYANFIERRPFPVLESVSDMLEGFDTMARLASSPRHVIPGHDPLVLKYYPAAIPGVDDIVRLDAEPAGQD